LGYMHRNMYDATQSCLIRNIGIGLFSRIGKMVCLNLFYIPHLI